LPFSEARIVPCQMMQLHIDVTVCAKVDWVLCVDRRDSCSSSNSCGWFGPSPERGGGGEREQTKRISLSSGFRGQSKTCGVGAGTRDDEMKGCDDTACNVGDLRAFKLGSNIWCHYCALHVIDEKMIVEWSIAAAIGFGIPLRLS
jgi:hypothetical protein